jgi:hypothetical protein
MESFLCGAACVIVECPPPDKFQPEVLDDYTHESHDLTAEEVAFGCSKEEANKSRLNTFLAGRVALRRALKKAFLIDVLPQPNTDDLSRVGTLGSLHKVIFASSHIPIIILLYSYYIPIIFQISSEPSPPPSS